MKEGLTPKKLSLVITIGITVSIFPVIGTTTLICTLIAFLFNLNLPAIQLANYASFPLQITLFFPFLANSKPSRVPNHAGKIKRI